MRCSKCGTSFGSADVFCPECGIRVSGQSQAPIAETPPVVEPMPATPEKPEAAPEEGQADDGATERAP
jgi:uncharacterized Zn finger protein (UPF0148 family)